MVLSGDIEGIPNFYTQLHIESINLISGFICRATSTSNVMFAALPLSRRSSERELDPNKKRATSASGLDRQPGDGMYFIFL